MVSFRRLPGILYNHRYALFTFALIMSFVVYKLIHWRVICTNLEPKRHVNNLCSQYERHQVSGSLCASICAPAIHSISCQSFHAGKEVVFSAIHLDGSKMIFKMARQGETRWLSNLDERNFPSESEFEILIQNHVLSRLNISISREQSKQLARFMNGDRADEGTVKRKSEIRALWNLLQDNEYLIAAVFMDKDVFPKILGSCGLYFAVEYLKPAMEGEAKSVLKNPREYPQILQWNSKVPSSQIKSLSEDGDKENWSTRVRLANMILDLLSELDISVKGGFSLCDIKPSHFGISKRSGKLKFLDLDVVLPKSIANTLVANNAPCSNDNDCDLFDCKAKCNYITKKCDKPITNNNLQVVCEKIFLGWQISGRFIMPGLLMSQHTPPQLASLLRQCADPEMEGDSPHSVQERLMTTLSEIDRLLAASGYDYDTNISV